MTDAMSWLRQYRALVLLQLRAMRSTLWFVAVLQAAMAVGLVVGIGLLVPDISKTTATYLATGAAAQSFGTAGLVILPQALARGKALGTLEYYLSWPLNREAYVLALLTVTALMTLPAAAFCLVLGMLRYGVGLHLEPAVILVALLALLSVAGAGVAVAMCSPSQGITDAFRQLAVYYVAFFAPVLMPAEQLPGALRFIANFLPPTHAADGVRATLTDLPGTHLARSLLVMGGFALGSLALSAVAIRRRG